ncbi:MAG: LamG domain-containing protein [Solirubrobacteraceae bacterium]
MKGKFIAGLVSVAALSAASSASANVLPVGTWQFNEGSGTVAHDATWHPDNGTLQGGASWSAGRFSGALSFDGTGSVDVPDNSALEPASVSVSAWVNSSTSPGKFKYIVAKGASGCLAASYGLYTGPNGGLEFYASSNGGTSWVQSPDAGNQVWDGQWHNVVGTYDGSTVRLYVDGQQVGSGSADTAPIAYGLPTSNDLTFANYAGCSGLNYSGRIDQVRVFDRALGAGEVRLGYMASHYLPTGFPFDLML